MKLIKNLFKSFGSQLPSKKEAEQYKKFKEFFVLGSMGILQNSMQKHMKGINIDTEIHWVTAHIFWDTIATAFVSSWMGKINLREKELIQLKVASSEEFYQQMIASDRWFGLTGLGLKEMPKMAKLLSKQSPLHDRSVCKLDILVNNFRSKEKHFSVIADKEKNLYLEKLQEDLKNSDAINTLDPGFMLRHSGSCTKWLFNANNLSGVSEDSGFKVKIKDA